MLSKYWFLKFIHATNQYCSLVNKVKEYVFFFLLAVLPCTYRLVQKKGAVLLSTSLALLAVAGSSWAETFSQLSAISFAQARYSMASSCTKSRPWLYLPQQMIFVNYLGRKMLFTASLVAELA